MPRDATGTREALLRAGERLFAMKGVHGALTGDILRAAGQANGSAVHYHFGSREGLLLAIATKHVARMEPARESSLRELERDGRTVDLAAVVAAIVTPTAAELTSPDGRDFLRITAQLAGYAGFRTGGSADAIAGTALQRQVDLLEACCRSAMPGPLAGERLASAIGMLTATLADRARLLDAGEPPPLSHADFVDNLVQMMVGAIGAPLHC